MFRIKIQELKKWKEKSNRKPLILMGARQVGKTWLLKEFAKECFEECCYINFESESGLSEVFEGTIQPKRIIDYLGAYLGKKIEPEKTLIIFDEVQEAPRALTSLKYFAEQAPEYAICCAGSLLGVTLHKSTSFPVGKVDFITMNPMSFEEFMIAVDEEGMVNWAKRNYSIEMPDIFIEKYCDLLKKYFIIGGMPSVVSTWVETGDFSEVTKEQKRLLISYENDFSKHAPMEIVPKFHHVWTSIPSQLAKENKKFIYGLAKEGARAREYEDALLWLKNSGLVRRVGLVKGAKLPLKAYEDLKAFKIYLLDIGLLRTLCEIDPDIIIRKEDVFREFMGSLTEQYVIQQLQTVEIADNIYYWSEGATSEVDFIFSYKNNIVPVEAKAGVNVRAQSLRIFCGKYEPNLAIRTSLKPFYIQDKLMNLPLFYVDNLAQILDEYFEGKMIKSN